VKRETAAAKPETVIDAAQIDLHGLPEREFPRESKFRVSITRSAHDAIWKHARESVSAAAGEAAILEVGGVLVGNVYKDEEGPFLEVSAAIAGEHTHSQGTQMTFTPDTWVQVNRVKDQRYADAKIVGWYHTHPRFGVFLSDMDKFIHKHHFPQPWTTALVVDPVRETEGFFVWSDGQPIPAPEYWVGSQRRFQPPVAGRLSEDARSETAPVKDPGSAVSRASFALAAVLCFLALLFLGGYVYMREATHAETEKLVMEVLEQQRGELQDTMRAVAALNQALEASRKESTQKEDQIQLRVQQVAGGLARAAAMAEELQARVATQQLTLDRLQAVPLAEKESPAPPEVKKK
jgi:proteasome lid subunit RPN8/RPN11